MNDHEHVGYAPALLQPGQRLEIKGTWYTVGARAHRGQPLVVQHHTGQLVPCRRPWTPR